MSELTSNFVGQWTPFVLVPSLFNMLASEHDVLLTTVYNNIQQFVKLIN
jgi:hypothetical protein